MKRARRNRTARREPKSTPRKIGYSNGTGMAGFEKRERVLHFHDATRRRRRRRLRPHDKGEAGLGIRLDAALVRAGNGAGTSTCRSVRW